MRKEIHGTGAVQWNRKGPFSLTKDKQFSLVKPRWINIIELYKIPNRLSGHCLNKDIQNPGDRAQAKVEYRLRTEKGHRQHLPEHSFHSQVHHQTELYLLPTLKLTEPKPERKQNTTAKTKLYF